MSVLSIRSYIFLSDLCICCMKTDTREYRKMVWVNDIPWRCLIFSPSFFLLKKKSLLVILIVLWLNVSFSLPFLFIRSVLLLVLLTGVPWLKRGEAESSSLAGSLIIVQVSQDWSRLGRVNTRRSHYHRRRSGLLLLFFVLMRRRWGMDDGDLVCNLKKMEDKKCIVRWCLRSMMRGWMLGMLAR